MRTVPRPRRYLSHGALMLCRPMLAFDYRREAYVLRGVGGRYGPVLRENRRQVSEDAREEREERYSGPERRGAATARRPRSGATAVRG